MSRHGRITSFSPQDKEKLLDAMRTARRLSNLCGSANLFNPELRSPCVNLQTAIDILAERLTGKPDYYRERQHSIP